MHRYTAYYHRDGAFYVSEMIVAKDDDEALRKARERLSPTMVLHCLDRHVTVYEREKQDA